MVVYSLKSNFTFVKYSTSCYELMQVFTVTGLFAGQHNTKLHGTITGVIT